MSPRLLACLLYLSVLALAGCDSVVCVGGAITVSAVSPASTIAGSPQFTMTVMGSGFTSSSVVQFNGQTRSTTFVSGTELRASVLATDVATPGTAQISVTIASSNPQCSINGSNLAVFHVD